MQEFVDLVTFTKEILKGKLDTILYIQYRLLFKITYFI